MPKLTLMVGLPASGKTTKAKEIVKRDGNTVRVNQDLLGEMLRFGARSGKNASLIRDIERLVVSTCMFQNLNVIIDDTNLNPNTVQRWRDFARNVDADIQYVKMDTPIEECVNRDIARSQMGERYVGKHVIQKMALQYLDFMKGDCAVICDLDGTICDITHRLRYAKGEEKNWDTFFSLIHKDILRKEIVEELNKILNPGTSLILVSARPENYRKQTEVWLKENGVAYDILIMREENDKRDDTEVKSDIYEKYLKNLNIITVFDDRPKVIRMWQSKGLVVHDCGSGVEF